MYERYYIDTSVTRLPCTLVGKFRVIRSDACINCGRCIAHCIYEVHRRSPEDPRKMAEPVSPLCKNCFTCIQNCPRQALEMVPDEEFESLGNGYWTPHLIHTIWNEAEEGKIPVYGAGYKGPFKGAHFDSMWTDMSEIVRPTRDGIHGRESIATAVDLGRKLPWISDFENIAVPPFHEVQLPMVLDASPQPFSSENICRAILDAARRLGTLAFLDMSSYSEEVRPYLSSLALRLPAGQAPQMDSLPWKEVRFAEILFPEEYPLPALAAVLEKWKSENPALVVSLGLTSSDLSPEMFGLIADGLIDVVDVHADRNGLGKEGMFIRDAVRNLHMELVKKCVRDEVTILGKGGMAAAEHVPKLILCGADAVVLDLSLLVALGCRVCRRCEPAECPARLSELEWKTASQRVINLACAWRDQLLEVLSAMGIRDVRRLRGETGRAVFSEEVEKESLGFLFAGTGMKK